MLIDLKVCMMKMDSTRKAAMLADVKELLNSKDFKVLEISILQVARLI